MSDAADPQRQIRHGLLYIAPALVANLLPVATLPVFTRILSPADFGIWGVSFAYAAFATGIANLGMTVGYERNYFEARDDEDHSALLSSTIILVTACLALVGGLTFAFRDQLSHFLFREPGHGTIVVVAYSGIALSSLKQYFLLYLKNRGEARAYVWFNLDETLISAATSLFLVAYLRTGVIGLVLGPLVGASIVQVLLLLRFRKILRPRVEAASLRPVLSISLPMTPRIFMGALGNQFDKYLIASLGSLGAAGIYSVGQKIGLFVFAAMTALQNVYSPRVYRMMFALGERGGKAIGPYLTPFAYASAGLALLVILFAQDVLSLLAPQSFSSAATIVQLFGLHYALMFFGKQPQLIYAKKTFLASLLSISTLALMIAGAFIGVRLGGAVGAAAGTLFAGALAGASVLAVSQRYYRIDYEWWALALIFGTLALATTTVILLPTSGNYLLGLAVRLLILGAFVGIGMHLQIVSRRALTSAWSAIALRSPS